MGVTGPQVSMQEAKIANDWGYQIVVILGMLPLDLDKGCYLPSPWRAERE